MCFNATTSLITFTISLMSSIYLLYNGIYKNNKNDILFGILVILIGLMQLIEYFLWNNQKCNKKNHMFSLSIIVVLYLQGIITSLAYYKLYPNNRFFKSYITIPFYILYTIFTGYLLYWLNSKKLCSKPSNKSCRLKWGPYTALSKNYLLFITHLFFYNTIGTSIFLEFLLMNNKDICKYLCRFLFLPITASLALLYVIFVEINNKFILINPLKILDYADVFGSLWCFIAVFLGIVGVLHI